MPPRGPDVPVPMFEILVNSSTLSVEAAAHVVQVSVEEDTELPDMFSLEIVATDDLEDQFLWVDSEDLFSVGGSVEVKLGYADQRSQTDVERKFIQRVPYAAFQFT